MASSVFAALAIAEYQLVGLEFELASSGEPSKGEIGIGLSHQAGAHKDQPNTYRLSLSVGINADDDAFKRRGYRLEVTVVGYFRVDLEVIPDMPEEELPAYTLVNGLSMLYSGVRSIVSSVTGQSPVGRVTLPSVNMVEYLKSQQGEPEQSD